MDTPKTLYDELKRLEAAIEQAGKDVREAGRMAAHKQAEYELLKNQKLIELFNEEAETGIKRTEAIRQAIYRKEFSDQRFEWQLAVNELKTASEYLKALLGNQISVEVRLKLVESDMRFTGRSLQAA